MVAVMAMAMLSHAVFGHVVMGGPVVRPSLVLISLVLLLSSSHCLTAMADASEEQQIPAPPRALSHATKADSKAGDAPLQCVPFQRSCLRGAASIAAAQNVSIAIEGDNNNNNNNSNTLLETIVVPRCSEDVKWLADFKCKDRFSIILYNKCNEPIPDILTDMPCFEVVNQTGAQNKGNDVSFLTYMVDFYDRLPEMSWFIKATVRGFGTGTTPRPELFVPFQQKYALMKGLTYMSFGSKKLGTFNPNSRFFATPFAPFLCRKRQSMWTSSARSEFAVSRARLRRWPKCFYERLRDFLVDANKRNKGMDVIYMLERFYNTMFSCSVNGCGAGGIRCKGKILCFGNSVSGSHAHFDKGFTARRNTKLPAEKGRNQKVVALGRWRSTKDTYWNRRGKDWTT